nr:MAG TPA: tail tube protein [Caudoviricetes sp.]
MTNPYKYYGTGTVKVNGQEFELEDCEFTPSGIVREDKLEGRGFSEKKQGATLTGKLNINATADPDAINKMDDVTVVFTADTGQSWSMPHAWHEQPEAVSADGMTVTFKSRTSEKIS